MRQIHIQSSNSLTIKSGNVIRMDKLAVETVVLLESSEISVVLEELPRMPSTVWLNSKHKNPQKANKLTTDALWWWMMALCFATDTLACKSAAHWTASHLFECAHHNISEFSEIWNSLVDWLIFVDCGIDLGFMCIYEWWMHMLASMIKCRIMCSMLLY